MPSATVTDIEPMIESIVAPWIAKKDSINVVVGVIQGSDRWTKGWGTLQALQPDDSSQLDDSSANPPDAATLYEIGSVTKVFTAILLAILVEQGELTFNTPINQLGSAYQHLPATVTLGSLVTHTSGLPRLPSNLMKSARQDRENPYAAYTLEDLHEYLSSHNGEPGKTTGTVSYSNLGVGILGNILADHLGQSYEEAIAHHICTPLGLTNTGITLSKEQQARFAIGYVANGKPTKHWDLPTLAGAGALRSTTDDLLTLLAANLQPEQSAIAQPILKTHALQCQTFAPTPGIWGLVGKVGAAMKRMRGNPLVVHKPVGVSLGWFVDDLPAIDRSVYTFAGGTGGHRSFCGFIKDTQTGVVVLSNYADPLASLFGRYSADTVGLKILELLHDHTPLGEANAVVLG